MMFQTFLLTFLSPLFAGGNAFIHSKPQESQFFSKDYTTVLKGICCLVVIYVHVKPPFDNPLQDAIGSFGYVCVTIFFLISAYGMMLSAERKEDYLNNFWRNRLVSLLIPAVLVNIVSFCLGIVNSNTFSYSTLYQLNSYVAVLLQWCLWFYIVMWCHKKWFPQNKQMTDIILIAGVIISSLLLYLFVYSENSAGAGWCFERLGLVWGVLLYRHFDRFVLWMSQNRITKIAILTLTCGVLGVGYLKFKLVYFFGAYLLKIILGVAIILLLFTATSNRKFGDKISLWLGNISYEVYLSHGIVMATLATWLSENVNSGVFILLTVLVTLTLSTIVHSIAKPIVKLLRK